MGCGVPKILKNVLLGVGAFLMLLLAIFAVYETVFAFFGGLDIADGRLTKGDILTSVSIAVAALGAIGGWVLTSQHRQDDIRRMTQTERTVMEGLAKTERKEAKRVAEADANILYRRLKIVEAHFVGLLQALVKGAEKSLVTRFPIVTSPAETEGKYIMLENLSKDLLTVIPDTDEYFKSLHRLYVHEQALGEEFGDVLEKIQGLKIGLGYFCRDPLQARTKRFDDRQDIEKKYFFELLIRVIAFLIAMELCRLKLKNVKFRPPLDDGECWELKRNLDQLHGIGVKIESEHREFDEFENLQMLQRSFGYFHIQRNVVVPTAVLEQN